MNRLLWLAIIICSIFIGCKEDSDPCRPIWDLDTRDIAAYAKTDTGWLSLVVYNPSTVNAISLSQQTLKGDFEVSIDHIVLDSNDVLGPQFRMEIYDLDDENVLSGVAVHQGEAYAYVNAQQFEEHLRLIPTNEGSMKIERSGNIVSSSFTFGSVSYAYSDSVEVKPVGVRLVLGALSAGQGRIGVWVDNFQSYDYEHGNSTTTGAEVELDRFRCNSW
ncbi:MAG: hypothetical protein K9J17_12525 [Flavobacteriales bacterium]|nr:hypothetical protein [Flavobacteriales bacterium]